MLNALQISLRYEMQHGFHRSFSTEILKVKFVVRILGNKTMRFVNLILVMFAK